MVKNKSNEWEFFSWNALWLKCNACSNKASNAKCCNACSSTKCKMQNTVMLGQIRLVIKNAVMLVQIKLVMQNAVMLVQISLVMQNAKCSNVCSNKARYENCLTKLAQKLCFFCKIS